MQRFRQYQIGEIGVCSVVAAELAYGVAKSGSSRNRQALEMFLAPFTPPPCISKDVTPRNSSPGGLM